MGEDAHGVAGTKALTPLGEQRCRPGDEHLVGHRKAPAGREHLAGVAHGDAVAEQLGDLGQGSGEVDGPEDPHLRRGGMAVDEHLDHRGVGKVLRRRLAVRSVVADA